MTDNDVSRSIYGEIGNRCDVSGSVNKISEITGGLNSEKSLTASVSLSGNLHPKAVIFAEQMTGTVKNNPMIIKAIII